MNKNISILLIALLVVLIGAFLVGRLPGELKQRNYTICIAEDNNNYKVLNSDKKIISFHELLKIHDFKDVAGVFIEPAVVKNNPKMIYERLKKYDIKVILLERIRFPDYGELPEYYANLQLVRGHKIPNNEWLKFNDRKKILRFRRAIIERNARVIFLPKDSSYFLTKLGEKANPYKFTNKVTILHFFTNNILSRLIILLMLILLVVMVDNTLLLKKFVILFSGVLLLYLIFSWACLESRILNFYIIVFISVIFYKYTENIIINEQINFYILTFLSLLWGLSIYAVFSTKLYYLYLLRFRGIKLFLLLPILISTIQIVIYLYVKKIQLRRFLGIVIAFFILALFFLIMRSGNGKFLYSGLEEKLRDFFEIHLFARPRFKDIFGHAILLYSLYKFKGNPAFIILIPIGFIGQVSMMNTFLHFNHPIGISILQSIYGIMIGVALGYMTIGLDKLFNRKRL
ncbi:hypothetical protein J7L48_06695 [bacterium]|nr:hypothetical protein [bacterium]